MMEKRFVGVDSARGFGIVAMIFIHSVIQQIAHYNARLFIPTFGSLPAVILIFLVPFIWLGIMGPFFVLLTTLSATLQMANLAAKSPEKLPVFVRNRAIIGFFLIFISRSINYLIGAEFFKNGGLFFPPYVFYYKSETLDAIAWAGVIAPFLLLLIVRWGKSIPPWKIVAIFTAFAVITYVLCPFLIPWGQKAVGFCEENGLYFFRWLFSKFFHGRFKLAQTLANGYIGVALGVMLAAGKKYRPMARYALAVSLGCLVTCGIALLVKPTIINDFANEEVPTVVQLFSLAGQVWLILAFLKLNDYISPVRVIKNMKKTVWLRRYGLTSLTLFTLATTFGDWLFALFVRMWGDSVITVDGISTINWNVLQMAAFIAAVFVCWEFILRVWEKFSYVGSVEWILRRLISSRKGKTGFRSYVSQVLYPWLPSLNESAGDSRLTSSLADPSSRQNLP